MPTDPPERGAQRYGSADSEGPILEPVAILGTGAWGLTLAWLLGRKGLALRLWGRRPEAIRELREARRLPERVAEIELPPSVAPTDHLDEALSAAAAVIWAVPSRWLREVARAAADLVPADALLVSATKGIEEGTSARMTEVLRAELRLAPERPVVALSGPNLSSEIAKGSPAAAVAASPDIAAARHAQRLLFGERFRVYTNSDLIGVELAGALKNVFAIAAGGSDGLGFGSNAKGALLTRGLAEMTRLGVTLGAQATTFSGLAGIGDLIATCNSRLSRNWQVGYQLAQGRGPEEIPDWMHAEGIPTTMAVCETAGRRRVEMPITCTVRALLRGELPPLEAVRTMMTRDGKAETD